MYDLVTLGKNARKAARQLITLDTATKNAGLLAIAAKLRENKSAILEANRLDIASAEACGVRTVMIDRLTLTGERIEGIAAATEDVIALPDPVGAIDEGLTRPNGLRIVKTRVPIGVIAMIFEARPNVTVDAAVICLKSGNACILRGGKEAYATNRVLVALMREAVQSVGIPADAISFVEDTSHDTAERLMRLDGYVDLLIPRGSAKLIQSVVKHASVPTIETGAGNCHIYVDSAADLDMAVNIVDNSKTQRPSVCNSLETVLVHRNIAAKFLPMMKTALDAHNTELRGCPETRAILKDIKLATETDWETEYNDYILAVKVVGGVDEAMDHIAKYSTGHSDGIVTDSVSVSHKFVAGVDSAAVYVNASTRFTDGGEFGLGAEIGISTQKLHARGPMGLRELTSIKYIVTGDGQIRA
ncbi:MAG: Gamma-glutamyl phosphate reductase [Oscillospiraceae bacterium]|jgi:glutamate-5-semialdehyde dehydrogenase|nr:Gamma-glutamyl phosphate reductase [Oscillospiraceae bacterium]